MAPQKLFDVIDLGFDSPCYGTCQVKITLRPIIFLNERMIK